MPLCRNLLFADRGNKVNRHSRGGGQDDSLKGRHRSRKQKYHNNGKQDDTERTAAKHLHQHGRDDGINATLGERATENKARGRADKVSATADHNAEHGRNDRATLDRRGILDRVEFTYHLRKPPRTEACEHNVHAKELKGLAAKDARQLCPGGVVRVAVCRYEGAKVLKEPGEPADGIVRKGGNHKANNPNKHHDSLHKIGVRGGDVAARHEIYCSKASNDQHPHPRFNPREHGTEERTKTLIDRRRIRHKEHEDDDRCHNLHPLRGIALFKEIGHRAGAEALGHFSCSVGKQKPGKQAAKNRIADADPHRADADIPTVLTGIANKHDCREVSRTIGEGGNPCTNVTSADQKAVKRFGLAVADTADKRHCHRINAQGNDGVNLCLFHLFLPPISPSPT